MNDSLKFKTRQWLKRYIPAEILGTVCAVVAASIVFGQTHSYITATAAGWVGEGVGFFGYFITLELLESHKRYAGQPFMRRVSLAIAAATTNLLVEFLPAELVDNIVTRPYLMYLLPHYVKPYALGFLVGKFLADILFYALAVVGLEARKRWLRR